MDFEQLKLTIKEMPEYQVTREDKNRIYFRIGINRFVVCENGSYFNIYNLTSSGVFLPGPKSGASIQTIHHFVGEKLS